jgi:uncharacterized BrkB/YihY/UPF0761 family membrane protein
MTDEKPTSRVGDVVASIVLLVLGGIGVAMLAFVSLFLAMVSDGCGSESSCDFGLMGAGYYIALLAPPVVYVAAGIVTLVRLTRRKRGWWVPVVGALAALAVWGIGYGMLMASLGR